MICPYRQADESYVQEKTLEYDAEGRQVKESLAYVTKHAPVTCPKEECGAWKDGECWYYADSPIAFDIFSGDDDKEEVDYGSPGTTEV